MWKKEDTTPTPAPDVQPEKPQRFERAATTSAGHSGERATIGRSISIKGDVTGDEDLVIQGRVEGSVDLQQHAVTIGPEGEVKASVIGRIVTVEGRVEGDIQGDEQVILRSSAQVQGDITAPRVVLEDGARFRGGVDMGDIHGRSSSGASVGGGTTRPNERKPSTDSSSSLPDPVGSSGKHRTGAEVTAEAAN